MPSRSSSPGYETWKRSPTPASPDAPSWPRSAAGLQVGGLFFSTMPSILTTSAFIDAAAALRAAGCGIVWLQAGQKRPRRRGWTTSSQEPADYREGDNLGLLC